MPGLAPYSCQTRYQLQLCASRFYISIINRSGNSTDSIASLRIGEALLGKIKGPPADLSPFLPGIPAETIRQNAVLARGKLGLMNGATDWEDFFAGTNNFVSVVLPEENKTILSVRFSKSDELNRFLEIHKMHDKVDHTLTDKMSADTVITKISDNHLLIEITREPD